jgi:pilus assembly protein FimV
VSLRSAIAELRALLAQTPEDPRLLQRLGEALQKQGALDEAADTFTRVAEIHARDGYLLKAIALFKQVLKLVPERSPLCFRLAQAHTQLRLVPEAVAFLRAVRTQAQRVGDSQVALAATVELSAVEPVVPSHRVEAAW